MKKSEDNGKIEVYHRLNKLKLKTGFGLDEDKVGFIEPSAIARAQKRIEQKEQEYPATIKEVLDNLTATWEELKTSGPDKRDELIDKIYNYSNNIKDLTATYQHDLMQHFSLSLRNFCERINAEKEAHQIIVQAHLDVMWITYNEKLKGEAGPKAEELKKIVAEAIKKYF